MIRFATIGTSMITEKFLNSAAKCEDLCYVGAYSRDIGKAEEFAGKHGAGKTYDDLEKMAEDQEIDAVYIASPNKYHCEQALLMMSHKKHVLCEKPAASNLREFRMMMEAAQKNEVFFSEAMRSLFDSGIDVIQNNLHKLGTIRRISFQYCQYSSRYDKFKAGIVENAFRPELSNGALMDIGVYCVNPLVRLFGMPDRIQAEGVLLNNGADGAGTIMAGYGDKQAELLYSKIADSHIPSQIQGEMGCMVISEIAHPYQVKIVYRNGSEETLISLDKEWDLDEEAKEFARLIKEKDSGLSCQKTTEMALEVMDEVRKQLGIVFPADGPLS